MKTFEISELKTRYYQEWLKENGLDDTDNLLDEGKKIGVESFLDFIEDTWNKEQT